MCIISPLKMKQGFFTFGSLAQQIAWGDLLQNTLVVVLLGREEEGKISKPLHSALRPERASPPWRLAAGNGRWPEGLCLPGSNTSNVLQPANKRRCFGSAGKRRDGTGHPSFRQNPGGTLGSRTLELKRMWMYGTTCS